MIVRLISLCAILIASAWAATPASFVGSVIETASAQDNPGMIYVLSRNGSLRKVRLAGAQIVYSQQVPRSQREKLPAQKALTLGVEVRVLAEENGAGVWHARSIEILRLPGAKAPPREAPAPEPSHAGPLLSRRSAL
jgi:hypothetical protein